MSEDTVLSERSNVPSAGFSKLPLIRKFESLLTDDEFESAGFRIAHHPHSDTRLIVPASQFLYGDDEAAANTLIAAQDAFLRRVSLPSVDGYSATTSKDFDGIMKRIAELRALAKEDDLSFSESSASEALRWLHDIAPPCSPSIFLLNNGNIRFVWRNADAQLGVQFIEGGTAQFVFLGPDDDSERIFGSLKTSEMLRRISGLDLLGMLGF